MTALYVETSALLALLFSEKNEKEISDAIFASDPIVSSRITLMEAMRSVRRATALHHITEADGVKAQGFLENLKNQWIWCQISDSAEDRVSRAFPEEPVRTLDAIHIAAMLDLLKIYPDLKILTYDERIKKNIIPLGLKIYGT